MVGAVGPRQSPFQNNASFFSNPALIQQLQQFGVAPLNNCYGSNNLINQAYPIQSLGFGGVPVVGSGIDSGLFAKLIVSDVVDARSQPRKTDLIIQELARGVVPAHPQQIAQALCSDRCADKLAGSLIVQVANDIRYNRRTNKILANLIKESPLFLNDLVWQRQDRAQDACCSRSLDPNAYGQVDPALGVLVHLAPVLAQMRAAGIGSATAIDRLASSGSVFSNAGALNTWSNP
ncbi:hypothetical protein BSLG_003340 [Batrachochytrium salamandrivorans]|nr:hypothetical protein BSLG_003340 [Batrachochytrium salamandrivorans]